jgi:hypothetical protein
MYPNERHEGCPRQDFAAAIAAGSPEGEPRPLADVTARVKADWRYAHIHCIEHNRARLESLATGSLDLAMSRVDNCLTGLGSRGSAGVWLENESLIAVRRVLEELRAARSTPVRDEPRARLLDRDVFVCTESHVHGADCEYAHYVLAASPVGAPSEGTTAPPADVITQARQAFDILREIRDDGWIVRHNRERIESVLRVFDRSPGSPETSFHSTQEFSGSVYRASAPDLYFGYNVEHGGADLLDDDVDDEDDDDVIECMEGSGYIVAGKEREPGDPFPRIYYYDTRGGEGGSFSNIWSSSSYIECATIYPTRRAAERWAKEFIPRSGYVIIEAPAGSPT